jgi:tetratricopeptide (TPR) repeat protein
MVHVDQEIEAADVAYGQANLDEAERHLRAVLAFDPQEPRALHRLGHIAMKRDQPEVAADYFQQSLASQGHTVTESSVTIPTPTLAELYAQQGHGEAAADIYQELLERDPDHPRAPQWRARVDELAAEPEGGPAGAEAAETGAEAAETAAEELPGPIPGLQEAVDALPAGWEEPEAETESAASEAAPGASATEGEGESPVWQRARRLEAFLERVERYRETRGAEPVRRLEEFLSHTERYRERRRLEDFLSQVEAVRGIRELERLNE